jgi:hypothetical protein
MDRAQVSELRGWARRLEERTSDSDKELRAAAKAIQMLADEVEALQAKLVAVEAAPPPATAVPAKDSPPAEAPTAGSEPLWSAADDRLHGSFLSRLKRTFGFE